jgi:hypothetical protein
MDEGGCSRIDLIAKKHGLSRQSAERLISAAIDERLPLAALNDSRFSNRQH